MSLFIRDDLFTSAYISSIKAFCHGTIVEAPFPLVEFQSKCVKQANDGDIIFFPRDRGR